MAGYGVVTRSPAQIYAVVIGAVLVVAGIVGFFYSSAFGSPGQTDAVFGILSVNGWHNVVHIATGAVGLVVAGHAARAYAGGLGLVYAAVAIWGFAIGSGQSILGFLPVNGEDNVLHALIALAGVAAYFTSSPRTAPGRAPSGATA
ncbi:MAG: hypothetical protein QOG63_764 [Thermoleophilaceae bacterium]|nr:hypothetical protein [Thermoleophilaceae bacterium]